MPQFKTLQFPNTARGQRDKVKSLEYYAYHGWRVVSESIIPGKFRGSQACCLFLLFVPCAFLAGHHDDIIQVTLEHTGDTDQSQLPAASLAAAIAAPTYDKQKWDALIKYDTEIAAAVDQVRPLGLKWVSELASGYMALGDKSYLPNIVTNIQAQAEAETLENARLAAIEGERQRELDTQRQARAALPWYHQFSETIPKQVMLAVGLLILALLLWSAIIRALQQPASPTPAAAQQTGANVPAQASWPSPSFDCSKVHSQVLKLVCATPVLAAIDNQLAATFKAAKLVAADPEKLRSDEHNWLRKRNNSDADIGSLLGMYQARIAYLQSLASLSAAIKPADDQNISGKDDAQDADP